MSNQRVFICCLIGTALEWYDFALFGVLSPFLSQIFFPHQTKSTALILTLSIFLTGFVMRPLGAVFFGHIGDKYGRRNAVVLSIMTMTISTGLIGLMPIMPHHILAMVIILVVLRMIQGFSVSGELAGIATFLSETLINKKRFFFHMSFIGSTEMGGILLGSIIGGIAFSLSNQYHFSWRIPFLLSFFLGIIGIYLRLKAIETPVFQEMLANKTLSKIPIVTVIANYKTRFIVVLLMCIATSAIIYLISLAYPLYVKSLYGKQDFFVIQIILLSIVVFIPPFFAYFLNYNNVVNTTILSFILMAVTIIPPLWLIIHHNSMGIMLLLGILYAIFFIPLRSIISAILCLSFPNNVRYTGMGIAVNIAVLIGGSFPLISTLLIKNTGNMVTSGIIVSILSLLAGTILFSARKSILNY